MKRLIATAALLASFTPAYAEKWDLSVMTCEQFLTSDKDTIGVILSWLDAYYKDEDAPPVIDTEKFVENAQELAGFCAGNPKLGLITATDKLFGNK